jgi:hypothetical protein
MIVKTWMADPCPYRACVLLTAKEADGIRLGFEQPSGVCPNRPIGNNVKANIKSYASRCADQRIISQDAAVHLIAWSEGTLRKKPRPSSYSFLSFRQHTAFALSDASNALPWVKPPRLRHVDLTRETHVGGDSESDGDAVLPIGLDDD